MADTGAETRVGVALELAKIILINQIAGGNHRAIYSQQNVLAVFKACLAATDESGTNSGRST